MKTRKLILNLALDTIDACIDVVVKCRNKKMAIKCLKMLKKRVAEKNEKPFI